MYSDMKYRQHWLLHTCPSPPRSSPFTIRVTTAGVFSVGPFSHQRKPEHRAIGSGQHHDIHVHDIGLCTFIAIDPYAGGGLSVSYHFCQKGETFSLRPFLSWKRTLCFWTQKNTRSSDNCFKDELLGREASYSECVEMAGIVVVDDNGCWVCHMLRPKS